MGIVYFIFLDTDANPIFLKRYRCLTDTKIKKTTIDDIKERLFLIFILPRYISFFNLNNIFTV